MEKKKYEELELEVVRLDAEDVITTSSDDCGGFSCSAYDPSCYQFAGNYCDKLVR